MRPGAKPSAKPTSDERADHVHIVTGNAEDTCRGFRDVASELVAVVERKSVTLPRSHSREQAERIIRLRRRGVLVLDADGRRGQRAAGVAAGIVRFSEARLWRECAVE